jgi:TolB-like protein/Tfp pilus assembly protein PilF
MRIAARGSAHSRFGDFELDLRGGELRHKGSKIKLGERPFQILSILLEHPGEAVTREELRQRLWGADTFVDFEHSINTAVQRLRQVLGDDPEKPRYIETLPRHGYRFICQVDSGAQIRSIAVLPLQNLSRDPEQEFFADAMTEELITNLGKVGALRVISRTSVMRYKGTKKPVPEIAKELNVDALVEGTVRRSGDRVRITANLLHAPTDHHLWAETYERDLKDTLALQSDVTSAIAYGIRTRLTPQDEGHPADARPRPVNPEAYEAYLKGRYYTQRFTREGFKKSNEYLAKAIEADPNYAAAYAALADNCVQASMGMGLQREELHARGRESARRALELDPTLAEAHAALADVALHFDWDWPVAEREFQRALQLNPNLVTARESYAEFLMRMGRSDESIAEYKRAQKLDPLSLVVNTELGWSYGIARRYEQAITQFRQVLELDPNFAIARWSLGVAYEESGRHDEAIRALLAALAPDEDNWVFLTYLGYAYGGASQQREALKVLAQLRERAKKENVPRFAFALVHLGLGQNGKALLFLEEAYKQRDAWLITVKASPELDPLRSNPRFQALLRRMNFPP